MNETTYATYLQEAFQHSADMEGGVRVGQALMNVLWEVNEKLYRLLPEDIDCFYVDGLVAEFLVYVEANWNC
jgi:hypothetical protein